jgi:predicted lipoprotein with Yx(FWY)xxD motif
MCGAAGAGLLVASGAIHLDLYLTGYRSIPTIGWLFLLQVIAAFALAAGILLVYALEFVTRNRPATGGGGLPRSFAEPVAAASGALFALSTLGGYLLSLRVGLFGFREVRTTAGIVAGVIDVAAFAALAVAALFAVLPAAARPAVLPARAGAATATLTRRAMAAIAVVSVVAAALLGIDVAVGQGGSGQSAGTAGQLLKATQIGGVSVLTNSKGLTLYWFAPDSATASQCSGTCAVYWPPVFGKPAAGPGVTGTLGTIKRPDGTTQATYDGHPLYTYVGDGAPGQASGNNIDLNGGLWHEVPVAG